MGSTTITKQGFPHMDIKRLSSGGRMLAAKGFYTPTTIAATLGIDVDRMYYLKKKGHLPCKPKMVPGMFKRLYTAADLETLREFFTLMGEPGIIQE